MSATSVIDIRDASKRFGVTVALRNISLSVARGEMFGLIGPDGAGKTTLLRLICGLLAPDDGSVRLFDRDPYRDRRVATSGIGYVSQQFSLYGDLSIDENIEFFAQLHGVTNFVERRTRLLTLTGLAPFRRRLADRLSGGMKQKLALSCTLIHEPPLLVLDEPTTGVDPVSRREFWKLLGEFRAQGLTMILATPYLDEAERCSRVALVSDGRLLAVDTPHALQAAFPGGVIEVAASPARNAVDVLRAAYGVDRVQLFGDRVHLRVGRADTDTTGLTTTLAAAGIAATSIRPITPSLEDVFIDRLTRSADA